MLDLQSLRYGLRDSITRWFERPAVSFLVALKFKPAVATAVGLGIALIAAYFVYQGEFFIGGVLVLFSSVFDLLDGGIARATGRVSRRGAMMDSVFDRVSESTVLIALAMYYTSGPDANQWGVFWPLLLCWVRLWSVTFVRVQKAWASRGLQDF